MQAKECLPLSQLQLLPHPKAQIQCLSGTQPQLSPLHVAQIEPQAQLQASLPFREGL